MSSGWTAGPATAGRRRGGAKELDNPCPRAEHAVPAEPLTERGVALAASARSRWSLQDNAPHLVLHLPDAAAQEPGINHYLGVSADVERERGAAQPLHLSQRQIEPFPQRGAEAERAGPHRLLQHGIPDEAQKLDRPSQIVGDHGIAGAGEQQQATGWPCLPRSAENVEGGGAILVTLTLEPAQCKHKRLAACLCSPQQCPRRFVVGHRLSREEGLREVVGAEQHRCHASAVPSVRNRLRLGNEAADGHHVCERRQGERANTPQFQLNITRFVRKLVVRDRACIDEHSRDPEAAQKLASGEERPPPRHYDIGPPGNVRSCHHAFQQA